MPVVTPVTSPEDEPTVATDGVLLVQVPPNVASVSVVVAVPQIINVPAIGAGNGLIVIVCVAEQPTPAVVYVIRLVPGLTPVNRPELMPMVAIDGVPLVQVPPVIPALNPNVVLVR